MKTVKVSVSDYSKLQWFGSDNWMGNLSIEEVLHRIIEKEWREANPPEYQSTIGRGD